MGISLLVTAVMNYLLVNGVHDEVGPTLAFAANSLEPSTAQSTVHAALANSRASVDFAGPYLLSAPRYMQAAAIATQRSEELGEEVFVVPIAATLKQMRARMGAGVLTKAEGFTSPSFARYRKYIAVGLRIGEQGSKQLEVGRADGMPRICRRASRPASIG